MGGTESEMMDTLIKLFQEPYLIRSAMIRLIRKLRLGSYEHRMRIGAIERPHYGYCVYQAALLAKKMNYQRISVLEFGVAGGQGLLNLEYQARQVEELLSIQIDIYGFDTGEGLPKPSDYRDLPYHWKEGTTGRKVFSKWMFSGCRQNWSGQSWSSAILP
jgi:hypothetical protein